MSREMQIWARILRMAPHTFQSMLTSRAPMLAGRDSSSDDQWLVALTEHPGMTFPTALPAQILSICETSSGRRISLSRAQWWRESNCPMLRPRVFILLLDLTLGAMHAAERPVSEQRWDWCHQISARCCITTNRLLGMFIAMHCVLQASVEGMCNQLVVKNSERRRRTRHGIRSLPTYMLVLVYKWLITSLSITHNFLT